MQASCGVQYSEFVAARLASRSQTQVMLGLSIVYFCEFLKVHLGPVLFGGISAVLKGLLPGVFGEGPRKIRGETIDEIMAEEKVMMGQERHKTTTEDRKSSKGSENDIYMLRTHGYNKYRFVSPSFIQRNGLKVDDTNPED